VLYLHDVKALKYDEIASMMGEGKISPQISHFHSRQRLNCRTGVTATAIQVQLARIKKAGKDLTVTFAKKPTPGNTESLTDADVGENPAASASKKSRKKAVKSSDENDSPAAKTSTPRKRKAAAMKTGDTITADDNTTDGAKDNAIKGKEETEKSPSKKVKLEGDVDPSMEHA
jgi:hypothetical protein